MELLNSKINDFIANIKQRCVSCSGGIMLPSQPIKEDDETEEHYQKRFNIWRQKFKDAYIQWDEIKEEREKIIESFVTAKI